VRGQHLLRRETGERGMTGEQLVAYDAQGVDIRPVVGVGIRRRLLGCHVGRRAERDADRGERGRPRRRAQRFGHAEISDERVFSRDQHVVRLYVPMHQRVFVGIGQGVRDIAQDPHRFGDRKLALACEPRPQGLPLDQGHRVVQQALDGARRKKRNDVRVLKLCGELDLSAEPLDAQAGGEVLRQDLDDDGPVERCLRGHEDASHPAAAKLLPDTVRRTERALQASQ